MLVYIEGQRKRREKGGFSPGQTGGLREGGWGRGRIRVYIEGGERENVQRQGGVRWEGSCGTDERLGRREAGGWGGGRS